MVGDTPVGLVPIARREEPAARLFLFPWAGGGSIGYHGWSRLVLGSVDVWAVVAPGREHRIDENAPTQIRAHVSDFVHAVDPLLDKPTAFFGHSMGAIVAWEAAFALERMGNGPSCLFMSSCIPLDRLQEDAFYRSAPSDEVLLRRLRSLGNTPEEVLASPEMMDFLLPTIRADLAAVANYSFAPGRTVETDIVALGGIGDLSVPVDELGGWQNLTRGESESQVFDGGHFYLNDACDEIGNLIKKRLAPEVI